MESVVALLAIVFTAVALAPAAAHVLELPNKLPLTREAYLAVQSMYRGWSKIGLVVMASLITTLWLAINLDGRAEVPATIGFCAILLAQVVFWTFTFPVNRRTHNWTEAPDDWEQLRDRWELSHAASAVLNFIALVCVAVAILAV